MRSGVVSIVIPVFSRFDLLCAAVESVRAQTHVKWELLIVEDGSIDYAITWTFPQTAYDARIRLIHRALFRSDVRGAQVCRNLGLQMARGEAVLFLDSDDLLAPDCLRRRLQLLDADRSIDAVVGQALRFRDQPGDPGLDNIWGQWKPGEDDLDRLLAYGIQWQTSGPLWRRSALDRVGLWDERLQYVGHDHEFHVRALCRGLRVRKLAGVDYFWRVPRTDSLSSLESFKTRHRDGGMITAYRAILAEVMRSGVATSHRRQLMAGEVIRLSVCCRHFGGSSAVAEQALLDARRQGPLGPCITVACRLLLRCWWLMAGRVPTMAHLNRLASQVSPPE